MNRNRSAAGLKWAMSWMCVAAPVLLFSLTALRGYGQAAQPSDVQQQVQRLNDAVNRVQAQIDESQRELAELRQQLAALQGSEAPAASPPEPSSGENAADLNAAVSALRDTQAIQNTQITTLEQTKVESESKYPLKMAGLVLMTGIVSSQGVDAAQTPTVALHGSGSTAGTARQTILGLDARGPHLFGAVSHADLRFDFDGGTGGAYSGSSAIGMLRMRTAHADLDWEHSQAFFSLDRPLLSPDTPSSLTAVAIPALGWSGNLWAWNPQFGVSHEFFTGAPANLRLESALIDVADPPSYYSSAQGGGYSPPSSAEQSRWPGLESRVAIGNMSSSNGAHLGISGYFAPHRLPHPKRFDSWAGVIDFNLPFTQHTQFTGSAYRGQALGGLGAGAFKDYAAKTYYGEWYFRALDDIGGWLQWKQRGGTRLEFNEAFGIDNVPAHQLQPFAVGITGESYYTLARNRTITGNVIYSPSAYLLFSLEYRRIASSFVNSPTELSDIIGLAAGYRF